jgi:hypothetical protein
VRAPLKGFLAWQLRDASLQVCILGDCVEDTWLELCLAAGLLDTVSIKGAVWKAFQRKQCNAGGTCRRAEEVCAQTSHAQRKQRNSAQSNTSTKLNLGAHHARCVLHAGDGYNSKIVSSEVVWLKELANTASMLPIFFRCRHAHRDILAAYTT